MLGSMGGGFGALLKLVNDPQLGANANKAMTAIVEMHFAFQRMEAKLDFLVAQHGVDPRTINPPAAVPAGPAHGPGASGQPRLIVDDGSGGAPAPLGAAGPFSKSPGRLFSPGGAAGGPRRPDLNGTGR
jgi:hypothetical protein